MVALRPRLADIAPFSPGHHASIVPGLGLAIGVAIISALAAGQFNVPVMLLALVFGMVLHPVAADRRLDPGTVFASKTVLRFGIVAMGALVTVEEIAGLGLPVFAIIAAGLILTLLAGLLIGRMIGLPADRAILCSGAVAICGASAALAISAALPKRPGRERDTLAVVVGVTALSTLAMVAYPAITQALGKGELFAGLFFGAAIHDVAQVMGAGLTLSEDAGANAAVAKLTRVVMLAPTVLLIGFVARRHAGEEAQGDLAPPVPLFVIGFALVVLANSLGFLPPVVVEGLSTASRWALIVAVAALGLRTSLGEMVRVGPAFGFLLVALSVLLGLFAWFALGTVPAVAG
jgi:uncharacterized integral membrane protein (TIGR00698 family)